MNKIRIYFIFLTIILVVIVFHSKSHGTSSDDNPNGYSLVSYCLNASGGPEFSSTNYSAIISFGENILSIGGSPSYNLDSGYVFISDESKIISIPRDLRAVYIYPNPYKPGSGGIFDAPCLTFENLTTRATIKIFNIALEHIATLEKDSTDDEYKWVPKNDAGRDIASGLYIYYITDPGGHTTKGKFTIIR